MGGQTFKIFSICSRFERPSRLPQAHAGAPAVLVDEFGAGVFESPPTTTGWARFAHLRNRASNGITPTGYSNFNCNFWFGFSSHLQKRSGSLARLTGWNMPLLYLTSRMRGSDRSAKTGVTPRKWGRSSAGFFPIAHCGAVHRRNIGSGRLLCGKRNGAICPAVTACCA